MSNLVFYRMEKGWFGDSIKFGSVKEAELVAWKLVRHFKLPLQSIDWTSGRNYGRAYGMSRIRLNVDMNTTGLLCHELGHILEVKRFGSTSHHKRLRRCIGRLVRYGTKMGWWRDEVVRRLSPKPVKPMPTKAELRQVRIELVSAKIKRYEGKVGMYERKLGRARRSLMMLKKFGV